MVAAVPPASVGTSCLPAAEAAQPKSAALPVLRKGESSAMRWLGLTKSSQQLTAKPSAGSDADSCRPAP